MLLKQSFLSSQLENKTMDGNITLVNVTYVEYISMTSPVYSHLEFQTPLNRLDMWDSSHSTYVYFYVLPHLLPPGVPDSAQQVRHVG